MRKMPSRCISCISSGSNDVAKHENLSLESAGVANSSSPVEGLVQGDSNSVTVLDIPIVADGLTFEESLSSETRRLDELADTERRRQRRRWHQEVEMMREEIVTLHGPRTIRRCRSQSPTTHDGGDRAALRRLPSLPQNYFRRFFDTSGFDQQTVRVSVERGTLVLGVDRLPAAETSDIGDNRDATTSAKQSRRKTRYYRFTFPPSADLATMRAVLSTDGILLVEADIGTRTLSSPEQSLCSSGNDSGAAPQVTKREKLGKPSFRDDEDGKRRMHLLVDVGDSFRPKDIYVQAIKSDRFQIWAKRRFKTPERYLRAKYRREFELNEKIVSNTLWARLEPNGRLVVGAVAKHQPPNLSKSSTPTSGAEPVASSTAAGSVVNDRNDASSVYVDSTSFPPEVAAAAECPDILITCPDALPFVDNGHCSPDKQ